MTQLPKTQHEALAAINAWTGPLRPLLVADVRTASWLEALDAHGLALSSSSRGAVPAEKVAEVGVRPAELIHEAAVRTFSLAIALQVQAALAQGDEALATIWEEIQSFVFDRGLSFLVEPQRQQVVGALRVMQLSQDPSVAPRLAAPPVPMDFEALRQRIADTTAAFVEALDARDAQRAAPVSEEERASAAAVLRAAIKDLNTVLRIARDKLPAASVAQLEAAL